MTDNTLFVGRHCELSFNAALCLKSNLFFPYIARFERIINRTLLVMMAGLVVLATAEVAWILGKEVLVPPYILQGSHQLLELFGQFLLVLIGIELLHSMRIYTMRWVNRLEAVLIVALIAVARKVIILEAKELPKGTLLDIAAIALALALSYYLVQRNHREEGNPNPRSKG